MEHPLSKKYCVCNEFGHFPVVGVMYSQYTGKLDQIISSTEYDPEKSFDKSYWDVDEIQDSDMGIKLTGIHNKNYHAVLLNWSF